MAPCVNANVRGQYSNLLLGEQTDAQTQICCHDLNRWPIVWIWGRRGQNLKEDGGNTEELAGRLQTGLTEWDQEDSHS